jgi:hypothetical protein
LRAIVGVPLLHRDQCPPWLDDRAWLSFCHHEDRKDEKQLNFGFPNQVLVFAWPIAKCQVPIAILPRARESNKNETQPARRRLGA